MARTLVATIETKQVEQAYTPIFQGFGTVTNITIYWLVKDNNLYIRGSFTSGTPTGDEAQMTLPNSLVSSNNIETLDVAGVLIDEATSAIIRFPLIEPSVGYITFGQQDSTRAATTKQAGNIVSINGRKFSIQIKIPL